MLKLKSRRLKLFVNRLLKVRGPLVLDPGSFVLNLEGLRVRALKVRYGLSVQNVK